MSDCSVNSEPEPTHPDMSMNYESNQEKSSRTRNDSNTNRNSSLRRDLDFKNSVDVNSDQRLSQINDQCSLEEINIESNNQQNQQVSMIKQQQIQQMSSDIQAINTFKRKKIDANNLGKNKDLANENIRQSNEGLREIVPQNNAPHSLKLEFIQIDNEALNIEDQNDFLQENGIKKKAIGKSFSQKKNGGINSQNSIVSPQTATTNQINFQVQPPSYYFGDIKKDTLKQKQLLQQQQINQQSQQYQQSNQFQQIPQQQQQQQQLQNQNLQEQVRHKFRITNTTERAISNIKERYPTHSNQQNFTNHSQNENNGNENLEEDIENYNTNNIDYSVLSSYVNSNNQFSEHDHLNKLYDKDTSPFKKQSYTTKLAQQFDVKNNPYAVRPYSIDKSSQKRVKNALNNSMNSKTGQNLMQILGQNQADDVDKQKKTENSQNPSFIIINQIQSQENQNQKNFSNTANNIYKQTVTQLENLKAVEPVMQQQQSPIEKYVNVIKSQINNQNTEIKNNNLMKSPLINKQNHLQATQFNDYQKQFQSGNKKSVPDVLNNISNVQSKQNQMNMQRRVSQPHQRSITQDKYDEIIKSVLHPEKKAQAKVPEFRTNAISELKKQLNQMSGELEFERMKNQDLYSKLHQFRQKCLGKIDKQTKLLAKNEFEAEILHVELKVKALKKKIKSKDEELVILKDESEKQHAILSDYEKLKYEVNSYKENAENLMIKLDTKEKSIQELHRAHNNANADIERLFQETSLLKQKIDEKQNIIEQLEEQLNIANMRAQEANKLRQEIEVYKISQMQSNQIRLDAEKKKKEYDQKLSEFNKVKEENISLKLEMEHQCSQLKEQLQKREFEWKQLQMNNQKLNKEKEQFNQILKEEQSKREQLRAEIQRLQQEINQLNDQRKGDQLIQQNEKLKNDNANLRQENLALKGEVVKWQTKKQDTDNEGSNLKKQVNEFKLQIDDLNNKIKEYNSSTMRIQDADKLKNEYIILQREKDNMQQFYEQQIKELKQQLNNEIRQAQIYSIKLENYAKDSKIHHFPITTPISTNRKEFIDVNGNTSPLRSNTKKPLFNNNNNIDFNQQDHVSLSQKYSTKNSLYIEKKHSDCD